MRFGLCVIIALIVAMAIPNVAFHLFHAGALWNEIGSGKLFLPWIMLWAMLGAVGGIIIEYRYQKRCGSKPETFAGKVNMMSTRWPLLFGLGEAFFSLLIITWLPTALILSAGYDSPLPYFFPFLSLIIPARNAMSKQWRRFKGNILGLLFAGPIAFAGFMILAFSFMGMHPV